MTAPNPSGLPTTFDEKASTPARRLSTSSTADSELKKEGVHTTGVTFPDTPLKRIPTLPRTNTLGIRRELTLNRELTQEVKDRAAAGYQDANEKTKESASQFIEIVDHHLTVAEVAKKFDTTFDVKNPANSKGLTSAVAAERLQTNGPNALTPPARKSGLRKYLESLSSLFNILLIVAGILEYILLGVDFEDNKPNEYIGGILIAVAFVNAGIDYYQIAKAEAVLAGFLSLVPATCTVVRDGQISQIPAADLVLGDCVLIRMGDKTPADVFIFSAVSCSVDNSSLTGEAEPQKRVVVPEGDKAKRAAEAQNLLFNTTLVVSGEAWGVCIRTGDNTFIGSIASLTSNQSEKKSPLATEIDRFVKLLSSVAIFTAILFFIVGITTVYKGQAAATVTFAITILVAWIPEGLPATVTLLLSIAAQRMAKRQVLVKDLQGVEVTYRKSGTLGSLTMLATDKTGTLTRNQMTVTNVWTGEVFYTDNAVHAESSERTLVPQDIGIAETISICALNSKIKFNRTDVPFSERELLGDATETGLTRFSAKHLASYDDTRAEFPQVFAIPFNSTDKAATVVVKKQHATGHLTLYLKGAPERVLARCSTYLGSDGSLRQVDDAFKAAYTVSYDAMAHKGHRVIGCAQLQLADADVREGFDFEENKSMFAHGLTFVSLVSLEDPPKHGVREAVGTLRRAGIQVMMVTGDHPATAEAIARKINLISGETKADVAKRTGRLVDSIDEDEYDAVVVHGDDIDGLQGYQWDQIFSHSEIVFARTSPQHKLAIVRHAQDLGHIVGCTGDGVNDAPALKQADLGIAMNISGSDVSKESSKMILLDDNFASITSGVEEGRLIFQNLKRSIRYTVTHSIPEVIPQILYVLVPVPLPLSALLILLIDLGFELAVALSFAFDPAESADAIMRAAPRKPVSDASIGRLKARALRRIKTRNFDPETNQTIEPTRMSKYIDSAKAPFTRQFWVDAFEPSDDETLVDRNLLSYSYLEAGMIELIGALTGYFVVFYKSGFTPRDLYLAQKSANPKYFLDNSPNYISVSGRVLTASEQVDAWAKATSIMYLSIFLIQCFNIFASKAKFLPPFGKHVVSNYYNFAGILGGAVVAMFVIYTPPLHAAFGGTYKLSPLYWLIPIAFGCFLLAWSTARVYLTRRALEKTHVKPLPKLMMHPTMYSTGGGK
ncbi:BZ3500_MvSof-1268-A1-R1_Chr1-1g01094 [Microbotryum saponariae]|uniref:BZ3500_MvSof-1268-A1-R1_Chr1-1g01094 protein n=1 Tax=Microbotryum saponariae TaxID=289078 RepID=A0A2X0MDN6_9BASI|nr:BZ3500_MvSof-1268-A1-R1_Chr1-1g01094 [Microbotryum saponariae]SCZ93379.1 BZ3501_MvSof-1269-A2-R1_Chr1-1g00691 [Microbotryum saponariae]